MKIVCTIIAQYLLGKLKLVFNVAYLIPTHEMAFLVCLAIGLLEEAFIIHILHSIDIPIRNK